MGKGSLSTVERTDTASGDHGGHGAGAEETYCAAACREAGEDVGDLAVAFVRCALARVSHWRVYT